jgi:hypothetical protein
MNDSGSFDWGSLFQTATPVVNALSNYWAGNQIGKAGQAAQQYADPFGAYRPQFANALVGLQNNPSSVANLPGYQFGLDQSQEALQRAGAAKGYLGSGNILNELQKNAQGYASQQFNNERDFLARASGAYNNPATAAQFGLQGRQDQLGAYNQALGSFGAPNGAMGGAAGGGTANSLLNMAKTGKQLYDAYGTMNGGGSNWLSGLFGGGGATTGASELGAGSGGAFDAWAATQPGMEASFGAAGTDAAGALGASASTDAAAGAAGAEAGSAAGSGAASTAGSVMPLLGFAAATMALIAHDDKQTAKEQAGMREHGQQIANELYSRGFNPSTIDSSKLWNAGQGGYGEFNRNYLNQIGLGNLGYDDASLNDYLLWAAPNYKQNVSTLFNMNMQPYLNKPREEQSGG